MGKKRTVLSAAGWLLCAAMLLAGCVAGEKNTNLDEQSAAGPAGIIGMKQEEESTAETGSFLYEEGLRQRLSSEQERLLLSYMDCYYASMARLSVVDVSGLFAGDAQLQARGNQAVWEYQIGVRSAQLTDLSLAAYRYTLTCIQIEEQEGAVRVEALEDSVQNFSAHPQVNSEVYGCHHIFTMKESAGAWKLTGHTQWNSLYIYMTGSGNDVDTPPGEFDDLYPLRREELLSAAEEAISRRISQNTAAPELSAEHAYDRAAAVAYAHQWADGRNHLWPDYTRYGGNCQNYVSQCLLAGGDSDGPGRLGCLEMVRRYAGQPRRGFRALRILVVRQSICSVCRKQHGIRTGSPGGRALLRRGAGRHSRSRIRRRVAAYGSDCGVP